MKFDVLVEGGTDKKVLDVLLPRILGPHHSFKVITHRGKGKLSATPHVPVNPQNTTLLHNLPAKLRAYSRSLGPDECVVVLVDLDDGDCRGLKRQLVEMLTLCAPRGDFRVLFRIAIEELEAWYIGDLPALVKAYPRYRAALLDRYVQDSVCGTWELLADALHPVGRKQLSKNKMKALEFKNEMAAKIAPHMDVEANVSPSFQAFRDGLRKMGGS